jgi:hypothetical protein
MSILFVALLWAHVAEVVGHVQRKASHWHLIGITCSKASRMHCASAATPWMASAVWLASASSQACNIPPPNH